MGLAEQRGEYGHHEQHQQPGHVGREGGAERDQRDRVLDRGQQQSKQPDAPDRLPPRALELIVEIGILELLEVEGGRVAHELHAGAVGEEIAEQALEQRRNPREALAHQCDDELDHEQLHQPLPIDGTTRTRHAHRMDHLIDDQLADPEDGKRDE